MFPEPILVMGVPFHLFGLFAALSIFLGYVLIVSELRRLGINADIGADLILAFLLPAFLMARFMFIISYWHLFADTPLDVLKLWEGGLVLSGGLLGGAVGVYIFCLVKRLPFGRVADAIAPGLALGLAASRLGCWFAGCCYGRPTDLPWAVRFQNPHTLARPINVPLHPTQIYAFLIGLAVFAIVMQLRERKTFQGEVMLACLILISGARMFLDLFRGDVCAPVFLPVLFIYVFSLALYLKHKVKQRRWTMRVRDWSLAGLIFAVALFSACLVATDKLTRGHNLVTSDVNAIQKGVTTEKDVLKLFGPPTKIRDTATGQELLYEYAKSGGLRWLAVIQIGGSTQTKSLIVWLDKNGVVEDYAFKVT